MNNSRRIDYMLTRKRVLAAKPVLSSDERKRLAELDLEICTILRVPSGRSRLTPDQQRRMCDLTRTILSAPKEIHDEE